MTSGAIQAYVPACDILVVLYTSRAKPKSVIFNVLYDKWSFSIDSLIKTEKKSEKKYDNYNINFMSYFMACKICIKLITKDINFKTHLSSSFISLV